MCALFLQPRAQMPSRSFEKTIAAAPEKSPARACSRLSRQRTRGHAVIEGALLLPVLIFLFVGVFDMGFYLYAMIGVENAARVAVEYTAASSYTASDSN